MTGRGLTFPLVSRRRISGLAFGAMHGARRGTGSDVAASRLYRPGDNPDRVNWGASARLSSARNEDLFVVRETFADEAPRAVVALDRRAAMSICPADIPWLRKGEAAGLAADLVAESVTDAKGFVGRLEFGARGDVVDWCPPAGARGVRALVEHPLPANSAQREAVHGVFEFLAYHRRAVPAATFVFIVSDFLLPPPLRVWEEALDRGWDVVPVVVQDPIWELSFPDLDRVGMPLVDESGQRLFVHLRRGESDVFRARHEDRHARFLAGVRSLGIEPVIITSAVPESIFDAFLSWSVERQASWSRGS